MGRKNNKKKNKEKEESRSSTPQSSTPSVEDDRQQLLRRGACGSSDSRESRFAEKTSGGNRKTRLGKQSPSTSATSSRNDPESEHSPEQSHLSVPDQASGAIGSTSPSKRSTLSLLKTALTAKRKSPNRDSDPRCGCKDKKTHQPECPELKKLVEEKSSKAESEKTSVSESKPSSSDASPTLSRKTADGDQSSSSSGPCVQEHFRSVAGSEDPPERRLLAVSEQEGSQVKPSKKSPINRIKNVFRSKSRSPSRSLGAECSDDRTEDGLKKETGAIFKFRSKSPKRSEIGLGTSSSGPASSKLSTESSGNAGRSNSKSSSVSDPNVVECPHPGKGNCASECSSAKEGLDKPKRNTPSRNLDYDPQEGTSSSPARCEENAEPRSGLEIHDERWRRYVSEITGEPIGDNMNPVIQHVDDVDPDEEGSSPRRRSRSFKSYHLGLRMPDSVTESRQSKPISYWKNFTIKIKQIPWNFLDNKRKKEKVSSNPNTERDIKQYDPDGVEDVLLKRVESTDLLSPVTRNESLSPRIKKCACKGKYVHGLSCARQIEMRRRRKERRCRKDALCKKI